MQMIFGRYWDLPLSKCYGLNCYCSNTVEDYLYPALDVIPEVDFCIGYVGRLEKHYVKGIVQEVAFFLQKHVTKSFYVVFFSFSFARVFAACSLAFSFSLVFLSRWYFA